MMENPLEAIPVITPGVEARMDRRGCIQLRKAQLYSGGWPRRLAYRLGWRADVCLQLDEQGSFYWLQVNGENSLGRIAERLATRFGHPPPDSRRAVVEFTRELMARRLIQLLTPPSAAGEGNS